MRSIILLIAVACPVLSAQGNRDAAIRAEYAELMELLRPPEGVELDEEGARHRGELFQSNLGAFISRWIALRDQLKEGRLLLGKALALAGRPAEALPHLRAFFEAYKDHEDYEDAWITLATSTLDSRDLPGASALLSRFIAEREGSMLLPVARFYLGICMAQMGDYDGAVAYLDAVAAGGGEGPLEADAAVKAVEILAENGKADLAKQRLQKLLGEAPDAPYLKALDEQLSWIGRQAPEWTDMVSWPVGTPASVQTLRGRVVVLTFFADRYEACKDEVIGLQQLAGKFGESDVRFQVLTRYYRPVDQISPRDQDEQLKQLWRELRVELPLGVSTGFDNLRAYGVRGIPHTVVVGRDGRIVHVKVGGSRKNPQSMAALEAAVKRAL